MTVEVEEKITRRFRIKESFIKEQLELEGNLVEMHLWSGLTPQDDDAGKPHDNVVWEFVTVHTLTSSPIYTINTIDEKPNKEE